MAMRTFRKKILAFLVALFLKRIARCRGAADLVRWAKKLDFPTSTQRLGVRFTEKVRNHWRHRWLKFRDK